VVDGSNRVFDTPSQYVPGSLRVFVDGFLQRRDFDDGWIELGGTKFELKEAPETDSVVSAYFVVL
jgi:hypothetical protein